MPNASVFTLQVMVTSCESAAITKAHRWELAITISPFIQNPRIWLCAWQLTNVCRSNCTSAGSCSPAASLRDASPACQVPRKGSAPGQMPGVQPGLMLPQQIGRGLKGGGGGGGLLPSCWGCISHRKNVQYPTHSVARTLKPPRHGFVL